MTGIGGTEFPAADVAASNTTYWQSASGSDVISSALSYIPEQVWNDDSSSSGLSAGGGGVSALTSRPSWQAGVTGIPSGSYRLVPDISLDASPNLQPALCVAGVFFFPVTLNDVAFRGDHHACGRRKRRHHN